MRLSIPIGALALVSLSSSSPGLPKLEPRITYPQKSVKVTFYGYPDTHPDCSTAFVAYNCNNPDGTARNASPGGDGSWNNPLTMMGDFAPCSIVYLPYLRKYGIIDDSCPPCSKDLMDMWVQSSCGDDGEKVKQCEYDMTPSDKQVVYYDIAFDQGLQLPVVEGPLFDGTTQTCSHQTF